MDSVNNGYLTQYLDQNTTLARTLVVKLNEAAELINEGVVASYGSDAVDNSDPTTWKYYMNVSGEYHFTDTMMQVVSIDTLEPIEFTRENLAIHTATAAAHAYGTRHYHSLVAKYPAQEGLINSILTPADIESAIAAENGSILTYPSGLVESNEATLIQDLEAYLKRQFRRWYNVQFAMSDNLFVAGFYTLLHQFILPKLLNLRLARCKTSEAHSFHVRMYLASHGELDQYLPYLTLKQSLWLYRNIAYLERNPGKVSQFALLVKKLLTERGIPLGEYSIRNLDRFTADYLPKQTARLKLLNPNVNSLGVEYHEVVSLYEKERAMAIDNPRDLNAQQAGYLQQLKTANSAITQTKLLSSSMVDYADAVPEPFEEVALRQWCYMANHDLYDVSISFKDPASSEVRTLFARDAFFYLQYVLMAADGILLDTVPEYLNMQQRRHPKPTVADLLSVTDQQNYDLTDIATLILSRQPVIAPCLSVTAFFELASTLTSEALWHWHLIASRQDCYERAMVENMIKRLYEDVRMTYALSTTNVNDWLVENNLPVYNLTRTQAEELASVIFEAATGLTIDSTRMLKNIQKAMMDILKQLSSYSIQLTREINAEEIILVNWPAVRLGAVKQTQSDHRYVEASVQVLDATGFQSTAVNVEPSVDVSAAARASTGGTPVLLDPVVAGVIEAKLSATAQDMGGALWIDITYPGQDVALENDVRLPGYTTFKRLSNSQRQTLKFIA